jgi:hypothetical protein
LSVVAFSSPRGVKFSESSGFSCVHGGSFSVRIDDLVIVNDVVLEDTFSHDVVVSLHCEVSEFIGPSFDSRVL